MMTEAGSKRLAGMRLPGKRVRPVPLAAPVVRSQLEKKKSLFLTMGPPKVPPN
jgi:hypothetical protein